MLLQGADPCTYILTQVLAEPALPQVTLRTRYLYRSSNIGVQHPELLVRCLRFFLGADDVEEDEMDSEDEAMHSEVSPLPCNLSEISDSLFQVVSVARDSFNIHHKNTAPSQKKVHPPSLSPLPRLNLSADLGA